MPVVKDVYYRTCLEAHAKLDALQHLQEWLKTILPGHDEESTRLHSLLPHTQNITHAQFWTAFSEACEKDLPEFENEIFDLFSDHWQHCSQTIIGHTAEYQIVLSECMNAHFDFCIIQCFHDALHSCPVIIPSHAELNDLEKKQEAIALLVEEKMMNLNAFFQ
jgi:hypothetical protein